MNEDYDGMVLRYNNLIERLQSLARYEVGTFNEGDGYLCCYEESVEDGSWIRASDINELLREEIG